MSSTGDDEVVWSVDWGSLPAAELSPPVEPEVPASVPIQSTIPAPAAPPIQVTQPGPPPLQEKASATTPPVTPIAPQPAKSLVRGQRMKLADLGLSSDFEIAIRVGPSNGMVVDVTCLGLDEKDRLDDERYFVFFNQKQTPCGGITLLGASEGNLEVIGIALGKLPATISRLIVVAAIDGAGKMSDLGASAACLRASKIGLAEFSFSGGDLGDETALMMIELYRKSGIWRIAALGQGFAGGLAALLKHFGASVA